MSGILAVILVFGGLIFFHELGHFAFARLFGMGVKTFSLGFGPRIFSFRWGKTVYQLAALPLGGFCSLVGEEKIEDLPEPFTLEESFSLRPAWQRFFVIMGGSLFNLILAWIICWGIAYSYGKPYMLPEIGNVMAQSAAEEAGLKKGDMIQTINNITINKWEEISVAIQAEQGKEIYLEVRRQGEPENLALKATPAKKTLKNIFGDDTELWVLGIEASNSSRMFEALTFSEAAKVGMGEAYRMIDLTVQFLHRLVSGQGKMDEVGSAVSIARVVHAQSENGLSNVLFLAALISVNLGVLNLLPIPVLDGGTLVFLVYEMIVRRPLPEKFRYIVTIAGMGLLISLSVVLMIKDIVNWVKDAWF